MRQRSCLSFLTASVVVLLLISITGCNRLFSQSPSLVRGDGTTREPSAAMFVSKQAPVMVSMLVNPDRLSVLQRNRDLSKIKTSLLANTDIDYQKDIQPWLGNEITLAVTTVDIDRDGENGQNPGYLMALTTNEPEKSRKFVDLFFSKRAFDSGVNLAVEQYKGVKLIYENQGRDIPAERLYVRQEKPETGGYYTRRERKNISLGHSAVQSSLAGAVVGDRFVLFANDLKVLREAINNVQASDLNLTSSSQYQQATKQLPKAALAMAFLNLPIVAQWQGLELPEQIYNSEILSLVLNPKGLLTETAFIAKQEMPPSEQLSKPVGALQYIPAATGLAISALI